MIEYPRVFLKWVLEHTLIPNLDVKVFETAISNFLKQAADINVQLNLYPYQLYEHKPMDKIQKDPACVLDLTPLMWAVAMDNEPMATALLSCGAQVNAADSHGNTALDYANYLGLRHMRKILLKCASPERKDTKKVQMAGLGKEHQEVLALFDDLIAKRVFSALTVSYWRPTCKKIQLPLEVCVAIARYIGLHDIKPPVQKKSV